MTDEHRMEQLSRAYAQAVAAVAGCTWSAPEPDYGVDLTVRRVGRRAGRYLPVGRAVDLQLKSTAAGVPGPDHVGYDLDMRVYDLLRRATRAAPALLILYVLPADPADWLDQTEERLLLRGCAYWLSLRGEPASANTSTIRVWVPRANAFTPAALGRIMDAAGRGEDLS
ncbi:MAG: hypothetical protein C0501_23035 [Isosphaera sp.]|nr:hypothetical protein [Isosphaera sp.]